MKTDYQLAQEQKDVLWVRIPLGDVTGRSMDVVLRSLANQITAAHLDRKVTNFKIDRSKREIQIHFQKHQMKSHREEQTL